MHCISSPNTIILLWALKNFTNLRISRKVAHHLTEMAPSDSQLACKTLKIFIASITSP